MSYALYMRMPSIVVFQHASLIPYNCKCVLIALMRTMLTYKKSRCTGRKMWVNYNYARGVKMFITRTSRDVEMVAPIKQMRGKTNRQKKYRNKEGYTMKFQQPRSTFTSFKSHWYVLLIECQLHIVKIKSLLLGTHEPHACKLSLQAYKHQYTCTNMTVSDRLHSHAYLMCSAAFSNVANSHRNGSGANQREWP